MFQYKFRILGSSHEEKIYDKQLVPSPIHCFSQLSEILHSYMLLNRW